MKSNAILIKNKKRISLWCYEEFGKLMFTQSDNDIYNFVYYPIPDLCLYYAEENNLKFKNWKIILTSPPYFLHLDTDEDRLTNLPTEITLFKQIREKK